MHFFDPTVQMALLLATLAGLSTTIGSFLGIVVRQPGPRFMAFTLGFSAGVMIMVSFVELLPAAIKEVGFLKAHIGFFAGMGVYFLLDLLIPHEYIGQHDHAKDRFDLTDTPHSKNAQALRRTGTLVALGISIHNFPEGMATFVGAMKDINLGIAIATAIAIHNIPEGIAISAPIYIGTGNRRKAFLWSFYSGLSEVAGALLAALVLAPVLTPFVLGIVLAVVSGIMVLISIDELIPAANAFETEHSPIFGVIFGMFVMALSLWLLL